MRIKNRPPLIEETIKALQHRHTQAAVVELSLAAADRGLEFRYSPLIRDMIAFHKDKPDRKIGWMYSSRLFFTWADRKRYGFEKAAHACDFLWTELAREFGRDTAENFVKEMEL